MTTATTDVNVTDLDTTLATVRARILAHEITLASLRWFATLTHDDLDKLMAEEEDEDEMSEKEQDEDEMSEQEQTPTDILRRLSDQPLLIAATDGTATIPNATRVFRHIDSDFKNWGADEASSPTPELQTMLYEMVRNATFEEMFGSLNRETEHLCMTQSQIIEFVETHRNQLRTDGNATFFLFKSKGKFFVASVLFVGVDRLWVCVYRFENADVQSAQYPYRLVVPQR